MRTEPTEQENRLAIDALKAEETFPQNCQLTDARSGYSYNDDNDCKVVCTVETPDNVYQNAMIASFHGGQIGRFLADKLAREINAGVYNG